MSVDNIVIPGGILTAYQDRQPRENNDGGGRSEAFDIAEVARQRARSFTITLDSQNESREDTLERLSNILEVKEDTQAALQQGSDEAGQQGPPIRRRQRPITINLGGLGRSRVTGLNTPANPGLPLDRTSSVSSVAGQKRTQKPLHSHKSSELENSYIFQGLQDYRFTGQEPAKLSSNPPVFLARNGSRNTGRQRRESALDRKRSSVSQYSSINVARRASIAVENTVEKVRETITGAFRRSSLQEVYEKAKIRQAQLQRTTVVQIGFEYTFYLLMLATIYFVFIGYPLWNGFVLTVYYLFDKTLAIPAGTAIFLGIGFLYAYLPLLILFEKAPPERPSLESLAKVESGQASDTALLIPCYKSENLIAATLEAALKVFPAKNIFVIANGNSPTPLDNTAAVCESYGVSHTWSPIGSKIVAQFVGCYVSKQFPFVLLIDDDCLLPPNFPIVTDRIHGKTLCIGYTIKSVGPNSSKGTLCQQAQDVEYKISGIQRAFAGKIGSATFPHGAISIWDRQLLIKTFQAHPGFSVSEDWFFGHVARQLGSRIQMCTAVFVETETPTAIFFSSGGARGGFGEMTIWKQRFFRWNYFFVSGLYWDMYYIIRNWKLGWWEIGAKLFVFQEVYETLLYLLAPFVLPISFYVRPRFSSYMYLATIGLYQVNVVVFNYIHLRRRNESVSAVCLLYYLYYKAVLTYVNIASCYYSIYKYAKYFAKRHPKVIEDEKAVAVVLRLEEESYAELEKGEGLDQRASVDRSRRFTVTAIGTNLSSVAQEPVQTGGAAEEIEVLDFADQLVPIPEDATSIEPRRPSKTGRMPPPIPPVRRPYSWHRMTSNTSSDSNVSPLEQRKKPQFALPFPETAIDAERSSRIGRTPPPVSRSGQRFSWNRRTSNTSSDSNISPLEQRKPPQFPLPSPETAMDEEPSSIADLTPSGRASSSIFRRSSIPHTLRRSWYDGSPQVRQPSGAPQSRPQSQRSSISLSQRMSRRQSNRSSVYDTPIPTIEHPPPAALNYSRHIRGGSSGQFSSRDLASNPDTSRYITVLADTGNRSRDRLFINEEDEESEKQSSDGTILRKSEETLNRRSTQTDRSGRKVRVFINDDGMV